MAGVGDIAKEGGVKYDDAANTFKGLVSLLKKNEKVTIAGLGTFRIRTRNARTARNPKTGEPVAVPAKAVPDLDFNRTLKVEIDELLSKKLLGKKAGKVKEEKAAVPEKKADKKADKKGDKKKK